MNQARKSLFESVRVVCSLESVIVRWFPVASKQPCHKILDEEQFTKQIIYCERSNTMGMIEGNFSPELSFALLLFRFTWARNTLALFWLNVHEPKNEHCNRMQRAASAQWIERVCVWVWVIVNALNKRGANKIKNPENMYTQVLLYVHTARLHAWFQYIFCLVIFLKRISMELDFVLAMRFLDTYPHSIHSLHSVSRFRCKYWCTGLITICQKCQQRSTCFVAVFCSRARNSLWHVRSSQPQKKIVRRPPKQTIMCAGMKHWNEMHISCGA